MAQILKTPQIIAVAGIPGIGKTSLIRRLIEQNSSKQILYFALGAGSVPIDATQIQIEFPNVQILTEGQELELIEYVEQGAIAYIELGFHLDLRSGENLLQALSGYSTERIAIVPKGLGLTQKLELG